ncbi:MAG: acyl carrier protein [Bacteroidetes bacterium]|nr:acyl carrier protein [Bacteroidota bacterium]
MKSQIIKVMSAVFEVPIEDITETSSVDSIDSWDSLKHLNLILALEEEFNIVIPDEEVGNLMNYKLIELIINECRK